MKRRLIEENFLSIQFKTVSGRFNKIITLIFVGNYELNGYLNNDCRK